MTDKETKKCIHCKKELTNYNCYFKQLARKTQECEQLKEKYEALKLENQEGYEIVDELKQECEELEKQLEFARTHRTVIDADKNRYRKALEEIEEIILTESDDEVLSTFDDICRFERILDIISRAKGEE